MPGLRKADDPLNIEGSGFNYGDPVTVETSDRLTNGRVEAIHSKGKKLDVRIDHAKHPEHGRVLTFDTKDVEAKPLPPAAPSVDARIDGVHSSLSVHSSSISDLESRVSKLEAVKA